MYNVHSFLYYIVKGFFPCIKLNFYFFFIFVYLFLLNIYFHVSNVNVLSFNGERNVKVKTNEIPRLKSSGAPSL